MNLRKSYGDEGTTPENTLPLINIVFLLLTFFMVAGALERSDLFEVSPPLSGSELAAPDGGPLLLIGPDGTLAVNDEAVVEDELADVIAAKLGAGKLVRVKADATADAAHVVHLMEVLRKAGVEKVSLITVERG